jgi:hypothetical protein
VKDQERDSEAPLAQETLTATGSDQPDTNGTVKAARINRTGVIVAAVIGAVTTALSGWFFYYTGAKSGEATSTPTVTVTASPESSPVAMTITIDRAAGPVPRCLLISGTANPQPGVSVWLALHGREDTDFYGLTKVTFDAAHPTQWQAKLELGAAKDEGKEFEVFAFPLRSDAATLWESTVITGDYYLHALPAKATSEVFQRDSINTKPC